MRRYSANKSRILHHRFAVANAQDLSAFDSDSFDVVSCVAAIFMIPDPRR